ncbi:bifunctional diaminohydroxyphosphoribosylaminopyrimidine deaminase/5-amino-6-(5-phosphoribosylamino)uracil reductase RibD [Allobranchiibius sp. CTAmp26]|uniref:bifunctional diaminohydroxyphosphoribosylaminopyrimidine deaminase/5-amino-6-(5-phosphoribosylamino)uracil reductase RibD n=1 Tax=Allobranchiibius sp. CTAmp26 TaxID=2815214 RepID=UPI001AA0F5D4|nr:bifunctional diaminohydroxyphosphoribosylaminopyrimidine deaminase/5-amino-6-(5-phosphoribosylamino)uracil reductase RibD [Allobranchiibius sp. CTAmp26]MBO1754305.1 bifunctional diaminohydroxyphosphoribosylaminopyrimidine deaminase/5-amino-6-(5-phosphoribosylamino)uracil reductase RibD [Allobranchiibius sp. CTAmp26]
MDTRSTDETFLARALELAARGPGADPNPRVGCVVVTGDSVVGEGWHDGAGTPHAEVRALSAAGDRARGGTAYVTLEPCAHVGRTGPCADALVTAGVRRVVYAQPDPNPAARGGAALLSDAGVEVSGGLMATEAAALNVHWTFAVEHERPYVTWKFAVTLDGRSAAADGSSRWITGEQARADVHRLRASAGALVVGTGTVLADDPALTVRTPDAPRRPPLRVIVGEREIPRTARVLDDSAPTLQLPTHDPQLVLKQLHAQEIRHVWLEGGPSLAAAFLRSGLVDEVVAYLAPALLGDGAAAVAGLGIGSIDGIRRFELSDVTRLGDDVRLRMRTTTTPTTKEA